MKGKRLGFSEDRSSEKWVQGLGLWPSREAMLPVCFFPSGAWRQDHTEVNFCPVRKAAARLPLRRAKKLWKSRKEAGNQIYLWLLWWKAVSGTAWRGAATRRKKQVPTPSACWEKLTGSQQQKKNKICRFQTLASPSRIWNYGLWAEQQWFKISISLPIQNWSAKQDCRIILKAIVSDKIIIETTAHMYWILDLYKAPRCAYNIQ